MKTATPLLVLLICLCASLSGAVPPKGSVLLNEVLVDSRGGNPELEFIELFSKTPNLPIGGLSVLCIEGSSLIAHAPAGTILRRFDIPEGQRTNSEGFYLISNQRTAKEYNVQPHMVWDDTDKIPNDTMTIVLVDTREALREGESADPHIPFPSGLWDSVALLGQTEDYLIFFKAPVIGPDGEFLPAGATRVRDGVDSDEQRDWVLAHIEGPPISFNTPGQPNRVPQGISFNSPEPIANMLAQRATQPTPLSPTTAPQITTPGQPSPTPLPPQMAVQPSPTPPPARRRVQWRPYSLEALQQAVIQQGYALIYVRSGYSQNCVDFENSYLLQKDLAPLLADRALFFLNAHESGKQTLMNELGVSRVPTLVFVRQGVPPEYLTITADSTASQILEFLRKR